MRGTYRRGRVRSRNLGEPVWMNRRWSGRERAAAVVAGVFVAAVLATVLLLLVAVGWMTGR